MAERISRKEAARRLGCSVWQIVAFEKAGQLKTTREIVDERPRIWLDPEEVEKIQWDRKRELKKKKQLRVGHVVIDPVRGRLAAQVFALLCEGKDLREIVIQTKADPALVRHLYREWEVDFATQKRNEQLEREAEDERRAQRQHEREIARADRRELILRKAAIEAQVKIRAAR